MMQSGLGNEGSRRGPVLHVVLMMQVAWKLELLRRVCQTAEATGASNMDLEAHLCFRVMDPENILRVHAFGTNGVQRSRIQRERFYPIEQKNGAPFAGGPRPLRAKSACSIWGAEAC